MQECVMEYGEDYVRDDSGTTCASMARVGEKDWSDLILRSKNMNDLRTLQEIMRIEEDKIYSLDEVLSRVLSFYGKFVPYNSRT